MKLLYNECTFQMGEMIQQNPTQDVRLVLKSRGTPDPRRYNLPTGDDIAIVIPQPNQQETTYRDVVLYKSAEHHPRGFQTVRIHELHPMYDPTAYPIFFMHGKQIKVIINL